MLPMVLIMCLASILVSLIAAGVMAIAIYLIELARRLLEKAKKEASGK